MNTETLPNDNQPTTSRMTTQKTAVEAVFSHPFLNAYILQMAQALHAKDMCKKIYIPWNENATHRSISTAVSEEEEDRFFYFNDGDSAKEKIWYFSLTEKHYLHCGLKKVLLGDGDIFQKKILAYDYRVCQTIFFADQDRELEKQYSIFAAPL